MKNKIFKKYLNNEINIEELIHFFDTFNYTKKEIKEFGIIYTPMYISDYIVNKLNPTLEETVLEPSAGHGIFIISLLEYIKNKYKLSGEDLKYYFLKKVYAQDIIEENISEYKEIIKAYFLKNNINLSIEEISNAKVCDTLFEEETYFDIIFGNPPYIRTKNIKKEYLKQLRIKYQSCEKGNIDIYYAFMEFSIKNSKRSSMIVPNSWLYNKSSKKLMEIILDELIDFTDFKNIQIFNTAATYTSIFYTNKELKTKQVGYNHNLNLKMKYIDKQHIKENGLIFGNQYIDNKFKILKIHSPIATLRDSIYINHDLEKDNTDLIKFIKLSKIKSKEDLNKNNTIINPYKLINGKYIIKNEIELNIETLLYLKSHKNELGKRDKGKTDKYESWYSFGRKQGLNVYKDNTDLIIIPGMFNLSYIFFKISRDTLPKQFLFTSGFIIEVEKKETQQVLNFLNSEEFKIYIRDNGKIWNSKNRDNPYFSISVTKLKNILI